MGTPKIYTSQNRYGEHIHQAKNHPLYTPKKSVRGRYTPETHRDLALERSGNSLVYSPDSRSAKSAARRPHYKEAKGSPLQYPGVAFPSLPRAKTCDFKILSKANFSPSTENIHTNHSNFGLTPPERLKLYTPATPISNAPRQRAQKYTHQQLQFRLYPACKPKNTHQRLQFRLHLA